MINAARGSRRCRRFITSSQMIEKVYRKVKYFHFSMKTIFKKSVWFEFSDKNSASSTSYIGTAPMSDWSGSFLMWKSSENAFDISSVVSYVRTTRVKLEAWKWNFFDYQSKSSSVVYLGAKHKVQNLLQRSQEVITRGHNVQNNLINFVIFLRLSH